MLVVAALVVSGEDAEQPKVVIPDDIPGADVIVFKGDTYDFDLTKCTDDVGIVSYLVEFEFAGVPVSITNTTGHVYYTFNDYGQTWVTVSAFDAVGNEGIDFFSIDVAERITSDLVITDDPNYQVDHSLYLDGADLTIDNSTVQIGEGAGIGPSIAGGGAPEMLGESLTPSEEGLAGHWEPYYWYNYWRTGNTYSGKPMLDTTTKMSGDASIRITGATSYAYGFEYHFDANADLTGYNALTFWMHTRYNSYYSYIYYIYFYGSHNYASADGYARVYSGAYQQGGYSVYRGWHGYTIPLDDQDTGYFYYYNMADLSSVACIRIQTYSMYRQEQWIDNIGLSEIDWGDEITESTTPSGDYGGYWSGFSLSDESYVGSHSVYRSMNRGTYNNFYYYFNEPTDLSEFNALRLFVKMTDANGKRVDRSYYWGYSSGYKLYVYDEAGKYCAYREYPYAQTYYGYGKWYGYNLPWGTQTAYTNTGVDLTKVTYFRFANIYMSYAYPGTYPINMHIDGLEWYSHLRGMQKGAVADNVPLAIYVAGGDATVTGGSSVVGSGTTGARIMVDGGSAVLEDATFDNMWFTEGAKTPNVLKSFGGMEVYGDATISDVTFVNCPGPGLALFDGTYTLDQSTIDLSGTTQVSPGSPMLILGATNRLTAAYTIDLTGWTLENSPVGTGVLVTMTDCKVKMTVKVHENSVDNNAYAGIVISSVGARDDLDIIVYSQTTMGCGSGLISSVTGPNPNPGKVTTVDMSYSSFEGSTGDGAVISFDGASTSIDISIDSCSFNTNSNGLLVVVKDATGAVDVSLTDVTGEANLKDGVAIALEGQSGNAGVEVKDSEFNGNVAAGLSIMVRSAIAMPGTSIGISVYETLFEDNMAYGLLVGSDGATLEADASLTDLEAVGNIGHGIGISVAKTIGNFTFTVKDVESWDNSGSGMHIVTSQQSSGGVAYEGRVMIDLDSCQFHDNIGNGVTEEHHFAAAADEELRPLMEYELTAHNLTLRLNRGHGYYVGPLGTPAFGLRDANYEIRDCVFSDNDLAGLHIREGYNNNNLQGYVREMYNITNCTFANNIIGLEQYWNRFSYGTESSVRISQCTFTGNEAEAIYAHGYRGGYSGESCLLAAEYEILSSFMDSQVSLDIGGAYDQNGLAYPSIEVTIVDNTYRSDMPMSIIMGGYYNSLKNPVSTSLLYRANVHEVASAEDGLNVEMYGGTKLSGIVNIEDIDIKNPTGHGIRIVYGTLHNTEAQRKLAVVQITVTDVNIRNCLSSGIDIEEYHYIDVEAYAIGHFSLLRVDVQSAEFGVKSEGTAGEIRDSRFFRIVENAINTKNGIIDVYNSDIGAITRANLKANEYGAIRLWFPLQVKVLWKDSGNPVIGASLSVRDNTWSTIGVSIVQDADGKTFSNLNTMTVDYLGIITRNPYIVNVEFRGIAQERVVNVTKATELTILMVDDIPPRIDIETPGKGSMQRERSIYLKGTSFDVHSAIDRVVVSIDGEFWQEASGQEVFELTIPDVPEGLIVVLVRAYDASDNYWEESISVLVDSTPPSLKIISPVEGMRTNSQTIEVLGTTDVGARAYINGQLVEIDYTFISKTVLLNEGPNVIKVKVIDLIGNDEEIIINVIVDTQAPYLAIISPMNGAIVNTKDVRLMGHTESTGVTIQISGLTVPVDEEGYFTVDVILEPGINHLEITAVDEVGNERRLPVTLTFDGDPPWIKIAEPIPGSLFNTREIVVAGYAMEGTRVFLNGIEIDVVLGQFETTISTQEGHVDILVVGIDNAGNVMSLTVPITVDSVFPGLEIVAPVDGLLTNVRELQIEGLITPMEDPKYLELLINGAQYSIGMDGTISQAIDLADGVNLITIEVADLVGNSVSVTRTVTLDTLPPYLSVMVENTRIDAFLTDPVSLGTFVYVTGFTETGTSLTINGIFVEVDPANGHFNYTMDLPMPQEGSKVSRTLIHVVSADEAGNTAAQEEWVNRLEGERTQEGDGDEENTVTVLVFALLILALSIVIAVGYMRYRSQAELFEDLESQGLDEDISVLDEGGEDEEVA